MNQTAYCDNTNETSSFLNDYRATIALNNTGVSLLERGAYREGMETLQDSLTVMKQIFRPTDGETSSLSAPTTSGGGSAGKLQKATLRLIQKQHPATPLPIAAPLPAQQRIIHVNPVVYFESSSVQPALSSSSSSSSSDDNMSISDDTCSCWSPVTARPIRIEPVDFFCPKECDADLYSAIILNNFGLSYLCLSVQAKTPSAAHKSRLAALKLFKLSYSIVTTQLGRCEEDDNFHLMRLSKVTMDVVNNLIQAYDELGEREQAQGFCHQLDRLGLIVQEMEMMPLQVAALVTAAAA